MQFATIESSGPIDIMCDTHNLRAHRKAELTFRAWADAGPPFKLQIFSPSGNLILERVIRDLPTGEPQAPPPITFSVVSGEYQIHICELRGPAQGNAVLKVP